MSSGDLQSGKLRICFQKSGELVICNAHKAGDITILAVDDFILYDFPHPTIGRIIRFQSTQGAQEIKSTVLLLDGSTQDIDVSSQVVNGSLCKIDSFDDVRLKDIYQRVPVFAPGILYHYCSLDKLMCILRSKTLWLSDLTASNDPGELVSGKKEAQEIIQEAMTVYNPEHDEDPVKQIEIDERLEHIFPKQKVYGLCLSPHCDQLSQWRGYADNCSGVAVGIRTEKLNKVRYFCRHVSYVKPELMTSHYRKMLEKYYFDLDTSKTDFLKSVESFYQDACIEATHTKSSFFSEEQEVRFVILNPSPAITNHEELGLVDWRKIREEEHGFKCVPVDDLGEENESAMNHFEIKVANFGDLIANITLGACCPVKVSEMECLLKENSNEGHDLTHVAIQQSYGLYRKR